LARVGGGVHQGLLDDSRALCATRNGSLCPPCIETMDVTLQEVFGK
jgi:hypothetical protein